MVTIQKKENGQYVLTIPKELAQGFRLEGGEEAEFEIKSRNALRLEVVDRNGGDSSDAE